MNTGWKEEARAVSISLPHGDACSRTKWKDQLRLCWYRLALFGRRLEPPGFHRIKNNLVQLVSDSLYQHLAHYCAHFVHVDVDHNLLLRGRQQRTVCYRG